MKTYYHRNFLLLAAFALSMLLFHSASSQEKQNFGHGKSLAPTQCRDGQISVRHVSEDAAMGGVRTITYAFTNSSSSPCTLQGYPRFEVLNKLGRLVRRATNNPTWAGGDANTPPPLVTIEPGENATFVVYYNAGGAGYVGKPCLTYRKVRIIAPGTKRGFVLRDEVEVCRALEVSPVVSPSAQ